MKAGELKVAAKGGASYLSGCLVLAAVAGTCLLGCSQKVTTTSSTISATLDQNGQHPAVARVTGNATVSCSDGVGSQGNPVDCLILGPGYLGEVALHKSVTISGAGNIQLTCSGQGRCSAVVVQ